MQARCGSSVECLGVEWKEAVLEYPDRNAPAQKTLATAK